MLLRASVELEVPRDRLSTFDPQLIAKYQRRFPGFDEKIRKSVNRRRLSRTSRPMMSSSVRPTRICCSSQA
jgi:transposase-like protein